MSLPIAPISEALLDLQHIDTSEGADYAGNDQTMKSVIGRLTDLGAFSVTFNDEDDEVKLEITPLLVAIATNQMFLTEQLAELRGTSPEAVRFEVREFLNFRDANS